MDIFDENGIGGGASGVAGGLLHPYSPKGFIYSTIAFFLYTTLDETQKDWSVIFKCS